MASLLACHCLTTLKILSWFFKLRTVRIGWTLILALIFYVIWINWCFMICEKYLTIVVLLQLISNLWFFLFFWFFSYFSCSFHKFLDRIWTVLLLFRWGCCFTILTRKCTNFYFLYGRGLFGYSFCLFSFNANCFLFAADRWCFKTCRSFFYNWQFRDSWIPFLLKNIRISHWLRMDKFIDLIWRHCKTIWFSMVELCRWLLFLILKSLIRIWINVSLL